MSQHWSLGLVSVQVTSTYLSSGQLRVTTQTAISPRTTIFLWRFDINIYNSSLLYLFIQTRAFSDSSYYNHQKRHLRRNVKNISSQRARASSDGGVLDSSKAYYSESLKRKFSNLQAEIKGLSPLRSSMRKIGAASVRRSQGNYNRGFVDNELLSKQSTLDSSVMSTFRCYYCSKIFPSLLIII